MIRTILISIGIESLLSAAVLIDRSETSRSFRNYGLYRDAVLKEPYLRSFPPVHVFFHFHSVTLRELQVDVMPERRERIVPL